MRKTAIIVLVLICSVFLGMQLVHTDTPPKVVAATSSPTTQTEVDNPQVHAILDRSCADCHSDRTNWPWYSHVAPVSWMITKHVTEARQMLDFSEWTTRPVTPVERSLICNAVSNGRMPLPAYTTIHQDAKLSKSEVKTLCDWAAAVRPNPAAQQKDKASVGEP